MRDSKLPLTLVVLMLLAAVPSFAQLPLDMAKFFRQDNLRSSTSSTLGWITVRPKTQLPPGAVTIKGSSEHWCRAQIHGQWASGVIRDGACQYPFLNDIRNASSFDALISINGSTRLTYSDWDRVTVFPSFSITTPQMILAVLEDHETGIFKPGFVDPKQKEAFFVNGDQVEKSLKATIITEEEPKEYELFGIELEPKTMKKTFSDVVKSEVYLENPSTEEKIVEVEEDFTVNVQHYWGSVKGAVTGTKFSTPEKSGLFVGDYNQEQISMTQRVSYLLPPGSAVKGKLIANMSELSAQYSASLTAIFEDGFQLTRPITALHSETRMAELRVDFEQPFNLADNSPIATLEETSTILRYSTTTTTTTTSTTPSPVSGGKPPRSAQVGVNGGAVYGASFGFVLTMIGAVIAY
ncbi:uncharacterized protein LOC108675062 [Hyalella azteca]|uniref:Uncharacterized protein LOC108675062 n=1 Tax=Hyalella azteca TaxID=294128 RepID=A0A8B7NXK0_HYAAZ|nr:uncharacterized protein LOC108675062 [Hyalella azteca]XP_047738298.1 uncharacterized protein LOC108675062 [Hyalella azteca]